MRYMLLYILCFMTSLASMAQHRQVTLPEKPSNAGYKDYGSDVTPFWFACDVDGGSSIMESKPNMLYAMLTVTAGYRFSEFLRLGAGVGGRMYVHNAYVRKTDSKFGIPAFINVRGNFISAYNRDGVPFWSINAGSITNEGLFVSPMLGYSFGGLRNNFLVGLSYTLSTFKDFTKHDRVYSYFGIKLGYEF